MTEDEETYIAGNWIATKDLDTDKILSGMSKEIFYVINIPSGAPSGSFEPLIMVEVQDTNPANNYNGTLIKTTIPFKVSINIPEENKIDSQTIINIFETDNKVVFSNSIGFMIEIKNNSEKFDSKPLINFQIVNPSNEIVAQEVMNESLSKLNPGETYSKKLNIEFSSTRIFDLGQFTAELLVTDTTTNTSQIKKINFIYIPYFFLMILLIIVIFILVFTYLLIERKQSRKNIRNYK